MIKNTFAVLFVFVVFLCAWSTPAKAQLLCFGNVGWCNSCGDPAVPGAYDCTTETVYFIDCKVQLSTCAPADAPQEVCLACQLAHGGHPVSLVNGNTYIEENDIRIPGLGGGLTLARTWNSMWPATQTAYQVGIFGPNWKSNFEERVFVGGDNYIKYGRGDGSFWSFGYSGGVWKVAAPANVTATLSQGSSYWTLAFQNGEQRQFDNTTGKLIAIIDRNGNTTQLSYDTSARLVTVTDPASRHLYFTYGSSTFLVASVTSDFGVSTSYSYDTYGRLTQVTEPDSSTLNFQYNSQSLISSVTDADSKVLESHTYDSSGRGLTSSRANGVDAITVSY